jgi:hypothetical protein
MYQWKGYLEISQRWGLSHFHIEKLLGFEIEIVLY